jgi:hypothetical protein
MVSSLMCMDVRSAGAGCSGYGCEGGEEDFVGVAVASTSGLMPLAVSAAMVWETVGSWDVEVGGEGESAVEAVLVVAADDMDGRSTKMG